MCSFVLAFAILFFAFTLAFDYSALHPLILCEDTNLRCKDYTNTEKNSQEKASYRQKALVFAQNKGHRFVTQETGQIAEHLVPSSLQGLDIPCPYRQGNGDYQGGTLEVCNLQETLQRLPHLLWKLWTRLEGLLRPSIHPTTTGPQSEKSTVELQPVQLGRAEYGCCSMDSTPSSQEFSETKIQETGWKKYSLQGKRQRKGNGRVTAVWATILTCQFQLGATMDEPLHCASSGCTVTDHCDWRHQFRQREGQANSFSGCGIEEAQRRVTGRRSAAHEGGERQDRTGGNQTLHSAVSQHGRAKKAVQEAQSARLQMHTAWRNFLSQSAQQWKNYAAQFMEQERLLTERLQAARDDLTAAKENLGSCKVAAGLEDREDTAMQSDSEELTSKDAQTVAGKRIAESFTNLSTSLQALHSQAEQAVMQEEEDQNRKRQRLASPSEEGTTIPDAAKPFGGAE